MLVPKSSTDYRALIGDRDAEDTTDLSDIGSDYDEPGKEISRSESTKSFIQTARTVIGGKNIDVMNDSLSPILPPKEFRSETKVYETIEQHMKISDEDSLEGETANKEVNEMIAPYEVFKVDDNEKKSVKNKVEKWDSFYKTTEKPKVEENFESLRTSCDSLAEAKNSAMYNDSQCK